MYLKFKSEREKLDLDCPQVFLLFVLFWCFLIVRANKSQMILYMMVTDIRPIHH